jgi:adenosylhomocysteine nucleosidase
VLRTLLVSGDRDLIAQDVQELAVRYGAVAGDWESGAIAWVAARNHTRLLILRGVTDLVSASGSEAYGDLSVFQRAAEQVLAGLLAYLADWLALALAPRATS